MFFADDKINIRGRGDVFVVPVNDEEYDSLSVGKIIEIRYKDTTYKGEIMGIECSTLLVHPPRRSPRVGITLKYIAG